MRWKTWLATKEAEMPMQANARFLGVASMTAEPLNAASFILSAYKGTKLAINTTKIIRLSWMISVVQSEP